MEMASSKIPQTSRGVPRTSFYENAYTQKGRTYYFI